MACGGGSLIDLASRQLNDAEPGHSNIRWTRADLLAYLNEALCMLAIVRPNIFLGTQEIELKQGVVQTLPPGVKALYAIEGTLQKDGSLSAKRPSKSDIYLSRWFNDPCATARALRGATEYVVASYSVDANDKQMFKVQPPVPPPPPAVKVLARVLKAPRGLTEEGDDPGVDCCYVPALLEWMLYRAYGVDDESASSPQRSREHFAAFLAILQIDAAQQAALMVNKLGASNVSVPAASAGSN